MCYKLPICNPEIEWSAFYFNIVHFIIYYI